MTTLKGGQCTHDDSHQTAFLAQAPPAGRPPLDPCRPSSLIWYPPPPPHTHKTPKRPMERGPPRGHACTPPAAPPPPRPLTVGGEGGSAVGRIPPPPPRRTRQEAALGAPGGAARPRGHGSFINTPPKEALASARAACGGEEPLFHPPSRTVHMRAPLPSFQSR